LRRDAERPKLTDAGSTGGERERTEAMNQDPDPGVQCSAWLGGILTVYPPSLAQRVVVAGLRNECLGVPPTQAYQLATNTLRAKPRISAAEWRQETEEMWALLARCSDSEGNGNPPKAAPKSRWQQVCARVTGRPNLAISRAIRRLGRTAYTLHQWCLCAALRLELAPRDALGTATPKLVASESRASVVESREATRGQSHPMSLAYGGGVVTPPNIVLGDNRAVLWSPYSYGLESARRQCSVNQ
jgi:hypothetical protein